MSAGTVGGRPLKLVDTLEVAGVRPLHVADGHGQTRVLEGRREVAHCHASLEFRLHGRGRKKIYSAK